MYSFYGNYVIVCIHKYVFKLHFEKKNFYYVYFIIFHFSLYLRLIFFSLTILDNSIFQIDRYVKNRQMAILREKMAILSNDYLVTLLVPKKESRPNFESKIKT